MIGNVKILEDNSHIAIVKSGWKTDVEEKRESHQKRGWQELRKTTFSFSSRRLSSLTIPLSVHGGSHSVHDCMVENDLVLPSASHREGEKITLREAAHFGNS